MTPKPLRVATWNVDHASNSSRPVRAQVDTIVSIAPDVLVLTETCEEVDLRQHGYVSCLPRGKSKEYGKYWTTIWLSPRAKHHEPLESFTNEVVTCARVQTDLGTVVVYGTIIPYGSFRVKEGIPAWHEHYRAIDRQGEEWARLAKSGTLIVAGDFNQTCDRSIRTYGTRVGREKLTEKLALANLECVTEENFAASGKLRADPRKGWARNNVDHICITRGAFRILSAGAWDHFAQLEGGITYLSDHNGVFVDLALL